MKILYLDPNAHYFNPTTSLFPMLLLSRYPDAKFYGPGYSSSKALSMGLEKWVDVNGPFDAVIIGWLIPFLSDRNKIDKVSSSIRFVKRNTIHQGITQGDLHRYFNDVLETVLKLPIPLKLVNAINFDSYAATKKQVDHVLESGVILIAPNHQFSRPLAEWSQEVFAREKHYQKKKERLSDAWFEFLMAYPERIVTACHYVGEHEFYLGDLEGRDWDIAIPGVEYALRRDAISAIDKSKYKAAPKALFYAYRFASKLGIPVYRHYILSKIYNIQFQRILSQARMVFTSSGGSGNLPRKYIEIPASGALLVCTPFNGFSSIGFMNEVNCITTEPSRLSTVIEQLRNIEGCQNIADAGRKLIMNSHSLIARGEQISRCLSSIFKGKYAGSTWEDGKFVIKENRVSLKKPSMKQTVSD